MDSRPVSRVAVIVAFLGALMGTSVLGYLLLWWIDQSERGSPLDLMFAPEASGALTGFAEVVVAVLGVAITVVAILVELAANRYTPRITDLFVRDPVNVSVLGFFVVTSILVVWVEVSAWAPDAEIMRIAAVALLSASLLALLPYFAYVFDFLSPTRVILTLRQRAERAIRRGTRRRATALTKSRRDALHQLQQLGEMALNAVDNNDKAIAIAAVNALADTVIGYLGTKPRLQEGWFALDGAVATDQDFVALHPDIVDTLARRHTWLEMKVFRQFQGVFSESLNGMRDINHLIAIQTRRIAARAREQGDHHARALVLRFLHTFLRSTINARDVRTAYNLYNEVRLVAEDLLVSGDDAGLIELAGRMKFYGQLAFHANLPFILETAAYDLCTLLEQAANLSPESHDALLDIFLDVDRQPDSPQQEASLRGVRKAQVKLATHYLVTEDEPRARRIREDMRAEPAERMRSIRAELIHITDPEYWEVSDRGINFDWLPKARRAQLDVFFSWFQPVVAHEG